MGARVITSNSCGIMVLVLVLVLTGPESISGSDDVEISVDPWLEPVWFVEGDPFILTCTVKGTVAGTVEWWKNAVPMDSQDVKLSKEASSEVPKMILTLDKGDVTVDDTGRYNCWYDGDDIGIDVKVITVTARDANLTQGYHTILTCDTEPYTHMLSISWLKGNTPLSKIPELESRLIFGQHNNTVTIMNSKLADIGVYTCKIQFNKDTEFEQTFSRSPGIRGKPYVQSSDVESLKKVSNTSITLVCPVRAYPEPEVFWKRGDDIIEASDHYTLTSYNDVPDSQLEIKNPTEADFGKYVCIMENTMGKSEYTIDLKDDNGNNAGMSSTTPIFTITHGLFFTLIIYKISL